MEFCKSFATIMACGSVMGVEQLFLPQRGSLHWLAGHLAWIFNETKNMKLNMTGELQMNKNWRYIGALAAVAASAAQSPVQLSCLIK